MVREAWHAAVHEVANSGTQLSNELNWRRKEQIKPRRVLECRNGKTRPLISFPPIPNVVTLNEFQFLLTIITCLLSFPIEGEGICLPPHPTPYNCLIQDPIPLLTPWVWKWIKDTCSTSALSDYQEAAPLCWQRLSPPHSNKLYSSFTIPHVWKFFSNLRLDHDKCPVHDRATQPYVYMYWFSSELPFHTGCHRTLSSFLPSTVGPY